MKNYRLTGTNILLKRENPKTQTTGGIYIPTTSQESLLQGTVRVVGPEVKIVGEGDVIILDGFSGTAVVIDGIPYLVLDQEDILIIFEK